MSIDQAVMDALMAKFYQVLTAGGTATGAISTDPFFISFAAPGLSVTSEELSFSAGSSVAEIVAASAFADLANSVPPMTGFWRMTDRKVWEEYASVLTQAVLPLSVLTKSEQLQLDGARALLWNGTQETPLLERYRTNSERYINAQSAYNSMLITLQTNPDDPTIKSEWTLLEPALRVRVEIALNTWIAEGRYDVEAALATIGQLMGRDPFRIWQESRQLLEQYRRTDVLDQDYYMTGFVPPNFHFTDQGWSRFTLSGNELQQIDTSLKSLWGGGTGPGYGLWSFLKEAGDGTTLENAPSDLSDFSLELEFKRVPLRRPWFSPNVLTSRVWKWPSNRRDVLSDGEVPPAGSLTAYPVEILVVRNLTITMTVPAQQETEIAQPIDEKHLAGWGLFRLRGMPLVKEVSLRLAEVVENVVSPPETRDILQARLWPSAIMRIEDVERTRIAIVEPSRLQPIRMAGPRLFEPLEPIEQPDPLIPIEPVDPPPPPPPPPPDPIDPPPPPPPAEEKAKQIEISQPGMQITAFICRLLPKCPDPDPLLQMPV